MKTILVTGGSGFIGCNACRFFAEKGFKVIAVDNLSRKGAYLNLEYILNSGSDIEFIHCDIKSYFDLEVLFLKYSFDVILHLAAQVAVTTSVTNPREDLEINIIGTFNLLELTRKYSPDAIFLYSSTNKVYGKLEDVAIEEHNKRYSFKFKKEGIDEKAPLDFYSPYGCSKGAADQYVLDYFRIYGLKTVVLRQSCIYGYRQFGIEDQGWVAWFTLSAVFNRTMTIYGNGKQVRDLLFIDDLIKLFNMAINKIEVAQGNAFNIGGGPKKSLSLLELIDYLNEITGTHVKYSFSDWRIGDQLVFICDITKAKEVLGWKPVTGVNDGILKLYKWVTDNKNLFKKAGVI